MLLYFVWDASEPIGPELNALYPQYFFISLALISFSKGTLVKSLYHELVCNS